MSTSDTSSTGAGESACESASMASSAVATTTQEQYRAGPLAVWSVLRWAPRFASVRLSTEPNVYLFGFARTKDASLKGEALYEFVLVDVDIVQDKKDKSRFMFIDSDETVWWFKCDSPGECVEWVQSLQAFTVQTLAREPSVATTEQSSGDEMSNPPTDDELEDAHEQTEDEDDYLFLELESTSDVAGDVHFEARNISTNTDEFVLKVVRDMPDGTTFNKSVTLTMTEFNKKTDMLRLSSKDLAVELPDNPATTRFFVLVKTFPQTDLDTVTQILRTVSRVIGVSTVGSTYFGIELGNRVLDLSKEEHELLTLEDRMQRSCADFDDALIDDVSTVGELMAQMVQVQTAYEHWYYVREQAYAQDTQPYQDTIDYNEAQLYATVPDFASDLLAHRISVSAVCDGVEADADTQHAIRKWFGDLDKARIEATTMERDHQKDIAEHLKQLLEWFEQRLKALNARKTSEIHSLTWNLEEALAQTRYKYFAAKGRLCNMHKRRSCLAVDVAAEELTALCDRVDAASLEALKDVDSMVAKLHKLHRTAVLACSDLKKVRFEKALFKEKQCQRLLDRKQMKKAVFEREIRQWAAAKTDWTLQYNGQTGALDKKKAAWEAMAQDFKNHRKIVRIPGDADSSTSTPSAPSKPRPRRSAALQRLMDEKRAQKQAAEAGLQRKREELQRLKEFYAGARTEGNEGGGTRPQSRIPTARTKPKRSAARVPGSSRALPAASASRPKQPSATFSSKTELSTKSTGVAPQTTEPTEPVVTSAAAAIPSTSSPPPPPPPPPLVVGAMNTGVFDHSSFLEPHQPQQLTYAPSTPTPPGSTIHDDGDAMTPLLTRHHELESDTNVLLGSPAPDFNPPPKHQFFPASSQEDLHRHLAAITEARNSRAASAPDLEGKASPRLLVHQTVIADTMPRESHRNQNTSTPTYMNGAGSQRDAQTRSPHNQAHREATIYSHRSTPQGDTDEELMLLQHPAVSLQDITAMRQSIVANGSGSSSMAGSPHLVIPAGEVEYARGDGRDGDVTLYDDPDASHRSSYTSAYTHTTASEMATGAPATSGLPPGSVARQAARFDSANSSAANSPRTSRATIATTHAQSDRDDATEYGDEASMIVHTLNDDQQQQQQQLGFVLGAMGEQQQEQEGEEGASDESDYDEDEADSLAELAKPLPPTLETCTTAQLTNKPARALWDLTSTEEAEISFQAGDMFTVLRPDTQDWVFALHLPTRREGYVPKSYLEPLRGRLFRKLSTNPAGSLVRASFIQSEELDTMPQSQDEESAITQALHAFQPHQSQPTAVSSAPPHPDDLRPHSAKSRPMSPVHEQQQQQDQTQEQDQQQTSSAAAIASVPPPPPVPVLDPVQDSSARPLSLMEQLQSKRNTLRTVERSPARDQPAATSSSSLSAGSAPQSAPQSPDARAPQAPQDALLSAILSTRKSLQHHNDSET
eukprot:m.262014 g.262014  ORF g.262014 m.262014 type:complete len:1439 (+) comp15586_c0_seq1:151-4467(+)